jgi:hypothetical protein
MYDYRSIMRDFQIDRELAYLVEEAAKETNESDENVYMLIPLMQRVSRNYSIINGTDFTIRQARRDYDMLPTALRNEQSSKTWLMTLISVLSLDNT